MRRRVRLTLIGRDPGIIVEIPAIGRRDELDDRFVFQGEIRMSPPLRRVLSEGRNSPGRNRCRYHGDFAKGHHERDPATLRFLPVNGPDWARG